MIKNLLHVFARALFASCLVACVVVAGASARQTTMREGTTVFRGSIGESGKIKIQMKLRREGDRLTGSYFYENIGKDLMLRGTIDAAGNFTLQEFDAAGTQTGTFKGKWKGPECDQCVDYLQGSWTKPGTARPLAFNLSEYPLMFSSDTRLVSKTLNEGRKYGKTGGYSLAVEYPQLEGAGAGGAKFNDEMRAFAVKEMASYRKLYAGDSAGGGELDLSYYVGLADEGIVSIDFNEYHFFNGAGDRSADSTTINYDLKRGRALKLEDVFKSSSGYEKIISDFCNTDLRRQYKDVASIDAERIANSVEHVVGDDAKWLVTKDGLDIIFDSNELGPRGSGETIVTIPYDKLRGVINTDGPLARFVR